MAKLTSKEWFVAVRNGAVMADANGRAIMAKTKKNVEKGVISKLGTCRYTEYGIQITKITTKNVVKG